MFLSTNIFYIGTPNSLRIHRQRIPPHVSGQKILLPNKPQGSFVGAMVGDIDGVMEGDIVGVIVGDIVGVIVGDIVGEILSFWDGDDAETYIDNSIGVVSLYGCTSI